MVSHAVCILSEASRDRLLSELRQLAEAHPDEAGVRELLALGLSHTWHWLGEEGDAAKRAAANGS